MIVIRLTAVSVCVAVTSAPGKTAPPDFALSETPRYVGRAIVALAADPEKARWNQMSVNVGQLAREYDFTDVDGSRPDSWRYIETIRETDQQADFSDYL